MIRNDETRTLASSQATTRQHCAKIQERSAGTMRLVTTNRIVSGRNTRRDAQRRIRLFEHDGFEDGNSGLNVLPLHQSNSFAAGAAALLILRPRMRGNEGCGRIAVHYVVLTEPLDPSRVRHFFTAPGRCLRLGPHSRARMLRSSSIVRCRFP